MSKLRKYLSLEFARIILVYSAQPLRALFLLVAIQHYYAGSTAKALIPASEFIGFFLAPLAITLFAIKKIDTSRSLSILYLLSAVGLVIVFLSDSLPLFIFGAFLASAIPSIAPPLVTTIWQSNVKSVIRGKLFGNLTMFGLLIKTLSGLIISWVVATNLANYRWIALFFVFIVLLTAGVSAKLPAQKITNVSKNPFKRFSLLKANSFITWMLIAWFIMASANLITYSLRSEFVAAGREFAAYDPFIVLMLVEVIPNFFRMISIKFWGRLFDRINFIIYRICSNLILAVSILLFFSPQLYLQLCGAILFGIMIGGSEISWNLWLTKYVPKNHVTDYMSIHIFLSGIRGSIMPFLGFYLIDFISFRTLSMIAASMILVGTFIFIRLYITEKQN